MERSNQPAPGLLSPDHSPPSPLWSRASSSSSLFSSFREESFDFRGYPPQSELEEVPSLRWLPAELRAPAASTRRSAAERSWSEGYRPLCKGHGKATDATSSAFEGSNGEKCVFLPASALMVREDEDQFWRCTEYKEGNRSLHAVELLRGYYLDVRGTVGVATLPPATEYAAHLVYRLSGESFGFGLQEASLEIGAQTSKQRICLKPDGFVIGGSAVMTDRWMSIEMGRFFMGTRSSGDRNLFLGLKEEGKVDRNRNSWGEETDQVLRWKEGLVIGGVLILISSYFEYSYIWPRSVVFPRAMDRGGEGLLRRLGSLALDEPKGFTQLRKRS